MAFSARGARLTIGHLASAGGFIPLVDAAAAGGLAVLVALVSNGPVGALIVLAVVVVVNQLEGNFLQPVLWAGQCRSTAWLSCWP